MVTDNVKYTQYGILQADTYKTTNIVLSRQHDSITFLMNRGDTQTCTSNTKVHHKSPHGVGRRPPRPLAEALVLALCVPAAGALALLLLLLFGIELLPVRLAVLVNQSYLGREGGGDEGRLLARARLESFRLVVILSGER